MAPRTKEQFEQIRKESAGQIAEAALTLFARQGFYSTSVDQIAKEAGVSKGLIYNYFKNKEDLLRHIVESAIEIGDHLVEDVSRQEGSPLEKFDQIIDDLIAMMTSNPTYWKLILKLSMQEEIAQRFENTVQQHAAKNLAQVSGLLEKLKVPDHQLEAMMLVATLDGMLLHYLQMGEIYPMGAMVAHIKKRVRELSTTTIEN